MSAEFELIPYDNGTFTLREVSSGQAMHSRVGPWEEATQVYVVQSGLKERLLETGKPPVVLWDVGMGLATNALAAIELWDSLSPSERCDLKIISFESRPEGLKAALLESAKFDFLERHRRKLETLLNQGSWTDSSNRLVWELKTGDFLNEIKIVDSDQYRADVIFYDFYDPRTCPQLWSPAVFRVLRELCNDQSILCTYVESTPVRTALVLSGFYVGYGQKTWAKSGTTVATPAHAPMRLERPLGSEWLEKWDKSSRQIPYNADKTLSPSEIRTVLNTLKQFKIANPR